MKFGKRTILWLIPLGILAAFVYFYGPKSEITESPYIDAVKQTSFSDTSSVPAADVFAHYCSKNKWVFFKTQKQQSVVEFKGNCTWANEQQTVNFQFLVDDDITDISLGALLLDNKQLTPEERTQLIAQLYADL